MLKKLRFKSEDNRNVRVWTIGQGEPVVVLHGLGITGLPLFPIFSLFLHKYMFILPEARGHGRTDFGEVNLSSKSLESYLADDLEEILNHLKVKPKYMIAYSMGAMTALEFLSREKNSFIKKYLHIDFPVVFYDKNNNNSFFRNSISNDLHNSHKDLIADLKKDKYHKKVKLDNDEISYVTELYF